MVRKFHLPSCLLNSSSYSRRLVLPWITNLVGDPGVCILFTGSTVYGETADYSYSHAVTVNDPYLQRS